MTTLFTGDKRQDADKHHSWNDNNPSISAPQPHHHPCCLDVYVMGGGGEDGAMMNNTTASTTTNDDGNMAYILESSFTAALQDLGNNTNNNNNKNDDDDDDDSNATTEEEQHNNDVVWSLASNCFFMTGGICYVAGASWDVHPPTDDDEEEAESPRKWIMGLYNLIWTVGPLVYLLNAIIDVLWAYRVKQREKKKRQRQSKLQQQQQQLQPSMKEQLLLNIPQTEQHKHKTKKKKRRRKRRILPKNLKKPKAIWRQVRKHVGHRRELSAAVTFGFAAAFGLMAILISFTDSESESETPHSQYEYEDDDIGNTTPSISPKDMAIWRLEVLSVHCYLLSAIFALCGRRPKQEPSSDTSTTDNDNTNTNNGNTSTGTISNWRDAWSNAEFLGDLGDAFFGVGSVVDVILCDFHFDDDVAFWPVFSAVLWLLDACFYLRSDCCTLYTQSAAIRRTESVSTMGGDESYYSEGNYDNNMNDDSFSTCSTSTVSTAHHYFT